jgi:hypothetical protein
MCDNLNNASSTMLENDDNDEQDQGQVLVLHFR